MSEKTLREAYRDVSDVKGASDSGCREKTKLKVIALL
jgi:hypothetical protein